ncbi:MAG: hypothetical protein MRJ67_03760 [Nitrospirales bacterium]|nr:hypothetical protein [Nitrospirales bacterium]MDR4482714.1 hypothetical protein [Nitrospirales bacterium]
MPINVLLKNFPRGRGPEPSQAPSKEIQALPEGEEQAKEADLAAQEIQALWESQEIGISRWSGESGQRYSDPD